MTQHGWRATPAAPTIFHIVHVDRLESIAHSGHLLCDVLVSKKSLPGTTIGIDEIKKSRRERRVTSCPGLRVGQCVPFYFCPRSVMLYLLYKGNHPNLTYRGGQDPIVHLEADMLETVNWAESAGLRWAFTLSNAGSEYFEDRCRLENLHEIDWNAVSAQNWRDPETKGSKQAEFLVEGRFSWHLVRRIGVRTEDTARLAAAAVQKVDSQPEIEVMPCWYY